MDKIDELIAALLLADKDLAQNDTWVRLTRAEIRLNEIKVKLKQEFTRLESENAILTGQHATMHTEIELLKMELETVKAQNEKLKKPFGDWCGAPVPVIRGEPQFSGVVLKIHLEAVPADKDDD